MEKTHCKNQLGLNFTQIGVAADAIMKDLLAGAPTLAGKELHIDKCDTADRETDHCAAKYNGAIKIHDIPLCEHQILKLQPSLEPKNDAEINRPKQNLDHAAGPSEIAIVSVLLEPVENKPTDKNDASRCDSDKAADQEAERSKRKSVNRAHAYPPPVPVLMQKALEATLRGRRHSPPWPSLNAGTTNRPMRKRGRE